MKRVEEWLEVATNIAILAAAIGLIYFIIDRVYLSQPKSDQAKVERTIAIGSQISLPNIDWVSNKRTLLFVLQKDCKYCTSSMQFYRELTSIARQNGVKSVVVSPDTIGESEEYLSAHQVSIPHIVSSDLSTVNATGTPTLILVNEKGEVVKSWVGKLPTSQEKVVIDQL